MVRAFFGGPSMTSNAPSPVASWGLYTVASVVVVHALGGSFGPPVMAAGIAAMTGAALWLRLQAGPLRPQPDRNPGSRGRKPPPDDPDGSAPVPSPVRPWPVLTGGAAKAIPSELH